MVPHPLFPPVYSDIFFSFQKILQRFLIAPGGLKNPIGERVGQVLPKNPIKILFWFG
jgi:hypothetical protein